MFLVGDMPHKQSWSLQDIANRMQYGHKRFERALCVFDKKVRSRKRAMRVGDLTRGDDFFRAWRWYLRTALSVYQVATEHQALLLDDALPNHSIVVLYDTVDHQNQWLHQGYLHPNCLQAIKERLVPNQQNTVSVVLVLLDMGRAPREMRFRFCIERGDLKTASLGTSFARQSTDPWLGSSDYQRFLLWCEACDVPVFSLKSVLSHRWKLAYEWAVAAEQPPVDGFCFLPPHGGEALGDRFVPVFSSKMNSALDQTLFPWFHHIIYNDIVDNYCQFLGLLAQYKKIEKRIKNNSVFDEDHTLYQTFSSLEHRLLLCIDKLLWSQAHKKTYCDALKSVPNDTKGLLSSDNETTALGERYVAIMKQAGQSHALGTVNKHNFVAKRFDSTSFRHIRRILLQDIQSVLAHEGLKLDCEQTTLKQLLKGQLQKRAGFKLRPKKLHWLDRAGQYGKALIQWVLLFYWVYYVCKSAYQWFKGSASISVVETTEADPVVIAHRESQIATPIASQVAPHPGHHPNV